MPIAEVETPDGRIAEFEVPEGAAPEDIEAFAQQYFSQPAPKEPVSKGSPLLPDPFERGLARAGYSLDYALHGLGIKSDEAFAQDTADLAKRLAELPMKDSTKKQFDKIYGSKSPGEFIWNTVTSPQAVGNLIGESLGAVTPAGALAFGAPATLTRMGAVKGFGTLAKTLEPAWAKRALGAGIFGTGSGTVEASTSFFTDMVNLGVETEDPEHVQSMLQDEKLVKQLRRNAAKRGVPIAAFDALTFTIAGMPFKLMTQGGSVLTRASIGAGAAAELGVQAAGGAAGEASAQLVSLGKIEDPVAIGLEGILEIITGGPQAVAATLTMDGTKNPLGAKLRDTFASSFVALTEKKRKDLLKETTGAEKEQILEEEVTGIVGEPVLEEQVDLEDLTPFDFETKSLDETDVQLANRAAEQVKILSKKLRQMPKETKAERKARKALIDFKTDEKKRLVEFAKEGRLVRKEDGTYKAKPGKKPVKPKKDILPEPPETVRTGLELENVQKDLDEKNEILNKNKETLLQFLKDGVVAPQIVEPLQEQSAELFREIEALEIQKVKLKALAQEHQKKASQLAKQKGKTPKEKIEESQTTGEAPTAVTPKEMPQEVQRRKAALEKEVKFLEHQVEVLDRRMEDEPPASEKWGEIFEKGSKVREKIAELNEEIEHLSRDEVRQQKAAGFTKTPEEQFTLEFGPRLKATEYSPNGKKGLEKAAKEVVDILRRIGGPAVDTRIVSELVNLDSATGIAQALRGAQWTNMAIIAMSNEKPTETAHHEGYHIINRTGALDTPRIQRILERDLPKYSQILQERLGVMAADVDAFLTTKDGREELAATLYGEIGYQWDQDGKVTKGYGLPKESHGLFKSIYRALNKIWDAFRAQPELNTLEDIFIDVYKGKFAVDELVIRDKLTRNQKVAADKQVADQEARYDIEQHREDLKEAVKEDNRVGSMSSALVLFSSKLGLGNYSKLYGKAWTALKKHTELTHLLGDKYNKIAQPFFKLDFDTQIAIASLLLHNNLNNQKATLKENGTLVYEKQGNEITVNNTEAAKGYAALQNAFRAVLDDRESFYRDRVAHTYDLNENFTQKDLDAKLKEEGINEFDREQLETIKVVLASFDAMRDIDYIPKMRFGRWAVSVHERTADGKKGKLVYFGKIEDASALDKYMSKKKIKYNPTQLEELKSELKQRGFGDTKKYIIYGADKKVQKNIDDLELFHSTLDEKRSLVDLNTLSLDMLSSMLDERQVDAEEMANLRKSLITSVGTKGFNKQFVKARDIDGYSTDWKRVFKAYLFGGAQSNSYLQHAPYFNNIMESVEDMDDLFLKKDVKKLFDYISNPVEDFHRVRAFNFFWTMGFNPSTALLQYMTLPTVTLGNMSQFDGNILRNLKLISRWTGHAGQFAAHKAVFFNDDGSVGIDIENQKVWDSIRSKVTHLSDEQFNRMKNHIIRSYQQGNLGANLAQEHMGPKAPASISKAEKVQDKARKALQVSGTFISLAEQQTRFATLAATLEQQLTSPTAHEQAKGVLKDENVFQEMVKFEPGVGAEEHVATYMLHRSHAVFGKIGRPSVFRGVGGAFVFAFMTWPHQMWGGMIDMAKNRGPEGRVGLAVTLGAMVALGGLVGIPGFEMMKELYEAVYKGMTKHEVDLLNQVLDGLGGGLTAETATFGPLRSLLRMDVSQRMQLPIPGEAWVLSSVGLRSDPAAEFGVGGSIAQGIHRFWDNYNNDAGAAVLAQDILPVQMSNFAKAIQYNEEGVLSRTRQTQYLSPEDVDIFTIGTRLFGVTDARIARGRERAWFEQVLNRQHQPAYNMYKKRMVNHLSKHMREKEAGNEKAAEKARAKFDDSRQDFIDWSRKVKYDLPLPDIMRSVNMEARERITGERPLKQFKTNNRKHIRKLNERYEKYKYLRD